MKKYLLFLFTSAILLLTSYISYAQAPPLGINYQAVARDNSGNPLAIATVTVSFNVRQSSANGPISFSETQTPTTNQFGLFTCVIGSSNYASLDSIAWGKHKYFLEVFVNGNNMGATQFMSVPYAFNAHMADSVKNGAGSNPWTRTPGKIFPSVLSDSVGIGTSSPSGKLSVIVSSGKMDAFNVGHQGLGHAGVFAQSNPANDSACLVSYTNGKGAAVFGINMGTGYGGAFAVSNSLSAASGLLGSTNGTGKGVFGINTGKGYAGAFLINNPNNDSAAVAGITIGTINSRAVYGINMGLGWGGFFQVFNQLNSNDALAATTNGGGKAGSFSITYPGSLADALYTTTNGAGNALWGLNTGMGRAGTFSNTYSVNPSPALQVSVANPGAPSAVFMGGNVGIGTNAPASSLEINGAVATTIKTISTFSTTLLDNTAEVWNYTGPTGGTFTLPTASSAKYRRYIIVNRNLVAVLLNITAFTNLTNGTTNSITGGTSIEIISDGSNWLQIK